MSKLWIVSLVGIMGLAGCGGGGGSVSVTGSGPDAQLVAGDTLTYNGQTFTVVSVSSDGTRLTVSASSSGFVPAATRMQLTLTKGSDGIYRYSSDYLTIAYDPNTNMVTWLLADGATESDLVKDYLSLSSSSNFNLGTPSSANAATILNNAANTISEAVVGFSNSGITIINDIDFSYENINVEGLSSVHSAGWTGLGANIRIIDDFNGYINGDEYFGVETKYGANRFTHGYVTYTTAYAVAPEATFTHNDDTAAYLNGAISSPEIDVVNWSFEAPYFFNFSSYDAALYNARLIVEQFHDPIGALNPNAVLVFPVGNAGDASIHTGSGVSGCNIEGSRYTADTCSAVAYGIDSNYFSHLDRTLWVGSYDSATETLASYSFSAGDNAKYYYILADGNSLIDASQGTSFAAPRVTGVVALTAQKFPNLTASERTRLILETANDLGVPGVDPIYGHGLLNAGAALNPIGQLN